MALAASGQVVPRATASPLAGRRPSERYAGPSLPRSIDCRGRPCRALSGALDGPVATLRVLLLPALYVISSIQLGFRGLRRLLLGRPRASRSGDKAHQGAPRVVTVARRDGYEGLRPRKAGLTVIFEGPRAKPASSSTSSSGASREEAAAPAAEARVAAPTGAKAPAALPAPARLLSLPLSSAAGEAKGAAPAAGARVAAPTGAKAPLAARPAASLFPQQLFSADEAKENILFHGVACGHDRQVVTLVGPSRSGKSFLANVIAGAADAFKVSTHPQAPCTFGAWALPAPGGLLVIDTEGQSHQVTDSTKKLFSAVYPLSNVIIFSSKELAADSFLEQMRALSSVMGDYKRGAQGHKPHLVVLVRDAESFDFQDHPLWGYCRIGEDGVAQTCDDFVQDKVARELRGHELFASIRGYAIPNLKGKSVEDARSAGDMPKLLAFLASSDSRPLMDLSDGGAVQGVVDSVNVRGGAFRLEDFVPVLMRDMAPYLAVWGQEQERTALAEKYGWDADKMMIAFDEAHKRVYDVVLRFPDAERTVGKVLGSLRGKMQEFRADVERKEEVYAEVRRTEYVSEGVQAEKGAAVGAACGALLVLAADVVAPPVAFMFTVLGAFMGARIGDSVKRLVKKAVVEKKQVGWKLGRRSLAKGVPEEKQFG